MTTFGIKSTTGKSVDSSTQTAYTRDSEFSDVLANENNYFVTPRMVASEINEDNSLRDTCNIYKCSKYSLVRWVRRYLEYGTVENKDRKEGAYKVIKGHVEFIINLIKTKPFITLTDILGYFHKKFNDITLSKTHLSNIIKYANLTYKKVHFKKIFDYS
jgi:transposase